MTETGYDIFAKCRGEQFWIALEQGKLGIELCTIEAHPEVPGRAKPFSLIFSGPIEPCLPQMTYRLAHQRLGELDIFLVPVARVADTVRYEAIFN